MVSPSSYLAGWTSLHVPVNSKANYSGSVAADWVTDARQVLNKVPKRHPTHKVGGWTCSSHCHLVTIELSGHPGKGEEMDQKWAKAPQKKFHWTDANWLHLAPAYSWPVTIPANAYIRVQVFILSTVHFKHFIQLYLTPTDVGLLVHVILKIISWLHISWDESWKSLLGNLL